MSKINSYQVSNISLELEQFRDEVTNLLNLGKFQYATITAAPGWAGQKGEAVFVMPSSGGTTFYFYRNTAWVAGWSVTV
jgi:hypothetical protein